MYVSIVTAHESYCAIKVSEYSEGLEVGNFLRVSRKVWKSLFELSPGSKEGNVNPLKVDRNPIIGYLVLSVWVCLDRRSEDVVAGDEKVIRYCDASSTPETSRHGDFLHVRRPHCYSPSG